MRERRIRVCTVEPPPSLLVGIVGSETPIRGLVGPRAIGGAYSEDPPAARSWPVLPVVSQARRACSVVEHKFVWISLLVDVPAMPDSAGGRRLLGPHAGGGCVCAVTLCDAARARPLASNSWHTGALSALSTSTPVAFPRHSRRVRMSEALLLGLESRDFARRLRRAGGWAGSGRSPAFPDPVRAGKGSAAGNGSQDIVETPHNAA